MSLTIPYEFEITNIPERNLLAAILELAVRDYYSQNELREHAAEWLHSEEKGEFTFIWIAGELDFEPEDFLRALKCREAKKFRI